MATSVSTMYFTSLLFRTRNHLQNKFLPQNSKPNKWKLSKALTVDTTSTKSRDHITPLDFQASHQTIPDTHVWDEVEEDKHCILSGETHSIPTVDMDDPSAMELMGRACQEWGAFQLTGHGVPVELLNEVGVQSRRLFDLPISQKMKAQRPSPFSSTGGGVSGYGQPRLAYVFPKQMWNEGFTIAGPLEDHASALWPHDYLPFCNVMEEYKKEMTRLADKLLMFLLQSLGVAREDMFTHCVKESITRRDFEIPLHLNSYPPCPEPEKAMGLMTHTDSTLFTILHQVQTAKEGGLQVLRDGVGWVQVPPITANSFVVNMGDLFDIISNGKFHSVRHRVTVSKSERRMSYAYFYFPTDINYLSPLPKLVEDGVPPLYRDVTLKEFAKVKQQHMMKALSFIKN